MKTVTVKTGRKYNIYIEKGLISKCAELIKPICQAEKVAVITDSNVSALYLQKVTDSLRFDGYDVYSYVFPAGEASKNLGTINGMYNFLAENRFSRKDLIAALGGGVTGDMAGFAAATYMRGIDFVQIPTSLLAQVDSSVGGKTGVDLPQGKNLIGSFYQPIAVFIDPDTLKTLPERFRHDGMAEVIKYGCIKDRRLFEFLEDNEAFENIEKIIHRCVSIKRDVVALDERESGERMLLNFGHTFGHAIEKLNNYTEITHGEAVAIGMVMMAKICEKLEICPPGTADRIALLCIKNDLPTSTPLSFREIAHACLNDKKATANSINLVLLSKIGESFVQKTPSEDIFGLM